MEKDEKREKYVIVREGSHAQDRAEIKRVVALNAKAGDPDSIRLFREFEVQDNFDTIIANADADEYEFAE